MTNEMQSFTESLYGDSYLEHYGIKGMKWGVRRTPEQLGHAPKGIRKKVSNRIEEKRREEEEFRQKLTNIQKYDKRKQILMAEEERRFKYRNRSLAKRLTSVGAATVANMLILDAMTGRLPNYAAMSPAQLKKELAKKAVELGAHYAINLAVNEYTAKSNAKQYDQSGKRLVKDRPFFSKEYKVEEAVKLGTTMAYFMLPAMQYKVSAAAYRAAQNRANFERWGGRILQEKVPAPTWNVVYQDPSGNWDILEKIKR